MAQKLQSSIQTAAIEGRLYSKGKEYLTRKLDYLLGRLYRYRWTKKMKVDPEQIMFITFQGDYTCNPKYIAEELRKRGANYKIVWSARREALYNQSFPKEFRLVEQYTADFYRELGRSKLVVANSVEFQKLLSAKKKDQCWIQTWHGSLGIKRFDAARNNGREWIAAAKRVGKLTDYIISDSTFENAVYRETFWPKTKILEYGHPRNDILVNRSDALQAEMRQKVLRFIRAQAQVTTAVPTGLNRTDASAGTEENEVFRYVLYAPTFRDNHLLDPYTLDYERLRAALSKRFGGTWKVLVRLHSTVREREGAFRCSENVIDLTDYPDIQEILLAADAAVTDYSSWIFDWLLTGKPGFIFATDTGSYDRERGLYFPLSDTPFPIAEDNDELESSILQFDEALYETNVAAFLKDKGCFERGDAAGRTADLIETIMK